MIHNTYRLNFAVGGIACIIAIPLIAILYISLFPVESMWGHFWSTVLPTYILNTIIYSFGTTLLAVFLGTLSAWIVSSIDIPTRKILQWSLLFPFSIPAYVVAFVYAEFFEYSGLIQTVYRAILGYTSYADYSFFDIRSLWGGIFVSAIVMYPYVFLMARASFTQQAGYVLENTKVMGHSAVSSFFKISLPIALPSIFLGALLIMMETLGDFGVVSLFGINTVTVAIYDVWLGMNDVGFAAQLSVILLVFVFVLFYFDNIYKKKNKIYLSHNSLMKKTRLLQVSRAKKALCLVFCWGLFFVGFAVPALILLDYSINFFEQAYNAKFQEYLLNSLKLATVGTFFVILFGVLIGYSSRIKHPGKIMPMLIVISRLGYGVPGAIFAFGVIVPFSSLDNLIDFQMEKYFSINTGLLLSGGSFLLIYAYVARFVNVGVGSIQTSLSRIGYSIDEAAMLMGHKKITIFRKIHLPFIKGGLFSGAIIVFVDIVKELPATLLLRPFDFETLSTFVYQYASDDLIEQASIGALLIVLLGMMPVILLCYVSNKDSR